MTVVLVRGSGDVGSAVAHKVFCSGFRVVIHDGARPPHARRGMAFADALYEGRTQLAGVFAKRARDAEDAGPMLSCGRAVVLTDASLDDLLRRVKPQVVVDARMRKRCVPESHIGLCRARLPCHAANKEIRRGSESEVRPWS